jgi:hypothetical protein
MPGMNKKSTLIDPKMPLACFPPSGYARRPVQRTRQKYQCLEMAILCEFAERSIISKNKH